MKWQQSLYDLIVQVVRVLYFLDEKYYVDPRQEPLSNRIVFIYLFSSFRTFFPPFCELREVWALEDKDRLSEYTYITLLKQSRFS